MVIAVNPDGIRVVWLGDNVGIVSIDPISCPGKTRVGINIALAGPAACNIAVCYDRRVAGANIDFLRYIIT